MAHFQVLVESNIPSTGGVCTFFNKKTTSHQKVTIWRMVFKKGGTES